MTDHDPPAADVEMFGQNAVDVASRIAAYVATNPDAGNWSPQRWAYEAVMVILNDQGAAHDVLRCMAGQTAYDLTVVDDDILAERDALAAEVERLRGLVGSLSMQWLNDDGQWINVRAAAGKRGALGTRWVVYDSDELEYAPDLAAAALTEETTDG